MAAWNSNLYVQLTVLDNQATEARTASLLVGQ